MRGLLLFGAYSMLISARVLTRHAGLIIEYALEGDPVLNIFFGQPEGADEPKFVYPQHSTGSSRYVQ
jgi:hypothetical protein